VDSHGDAWLTPWSSAAARASHASGNELTFVIADAGETTPELYRKTGFEPVGLVGFKWRYVKRL